MLAGAYALSRNGHVRGDFIYRAWTPRTQASMDLVLYFLFFFPGMLAFVYSGYGFAELSRGMNEHSSASPNGPIVWPFKWLISIVGVLMVMQGIVEVRPLRHVHPHRRVAAAAARRGRARQDHAEGRPRQGEYQVIKELEELGVRKGDI